MASLRDVFNHIGKRVALERGGAPAGQGLGLLREGTALVEPQLEPRVGDVLRLLETGAAYVVESSEPERIRDRIDHYKLRIRSQ